MVRRSVRRRHAVTCEVPLADALYRWIRVYPPGVSGSTPPAPVAGCAPWERRGQTNARPGRGPEPQSSGRGGDYPLKVTLLPSVINRWQKGYVLPPVTSAQRNTGFANRNFSLHRPFPRFAILCPGPPGCRDCSHAATKIKVDAEHPARMPGTPP